MGGVGAEVGGCGGGGRMTTEECQEGSLWTNL